jgi:CheY-like chemotaxis protein
LGAERTGVEGTGLGLALSRRLVEAMGGDISVESKPGSGTTLCVELEAADGPQVDRGADSAAAVAGDDGQERRSVVYIEDNLSNLRLVEQLVARLPNIRLIPAMQAGVGLDLIRQHDPDIVLLDLHLPDMDGSEVLAQLKSDPVTAGIPVAVLSADATPSRKERLLAAGAAAYLPKPVDVEHLLEFLSGSPAASKSG